MEYHLTIIKHFANINISIFEGILRLKKELTYKEMMLSPDAALLVMLFIIALTYTFFGLKLKFVTFNLTLGAIVYTIMWEHKKMTFNLPNILDDYLRVHLPEKLVLLFGTPEDKVIGFVALTICVVSFLSLIFHIVNIALYFTCIAILYLKFKDFFHSSVKDVPYIAVYEIIGFVLVTVILIYLLRWILDYILNVMFCIIGITMLTSFTIATIGFPKDYADFLKYYSAVDNKVGLIDSRNTHFLLLIVILAAISFKIQIKLWRK